jgi:hypothetical protein
MPTVTEQFWREILDPRRPVVQLERRRPAPKRLVQVRVRQSHPKPPR